MNNFKTQFEILNPVSGLFVPVTAVDEAQMREVDRQAVEEYGLGILQMMENAGRSLALLAIEMLSGSGLERVVVAAGSGGNGGGGVCAARHLINHGIPVTVALTKSPEQARGALRAQLEIISQMDVPLLRPDEQIRSETLVLDALIGYSLQGPPNGQAAELIERINTSKNLVLSLDLPSGVDATTGETPGLCIRADRTLTLALPKPGLTHPASGKLVLADIGIPAALYRLMGLSPLPMWMAEYRLPIRRVAAS